MNAASLMDIEDDQDFKTAFADFLCNESEWVDLDSQCNKGGYPEIDVITVRSVNRENGQIECKILVEFSETIPTSCADVELSDNKSCVVSLLIEQDGDVEILEVEQEWDGGEYFDNF
jgi:hypothetical protein